MTRKKVQPYRKAVSGPNASRRYTYRPPAAGFIAPSSPYASAPSSESTPPTVQTTSAGPACPPAWRSTPPGTRKMPDPITVPITMRIRSRRPRTRSSARAVLFTPRRHDVVHARVGDHLPEVLVQVAADAERDVGHRERLRRDHDFSSRGQRRRVERLELLLRVREAFVQVVDDLGLVGYGAQLPDLFAAAEIRAFRAERGRDEVVALQRGQHQHLGHRPDTLHRPPGVLVLRERLREADELRVQRLEIVDE